MGKFIYESGPKTEIEDRALTHLQLVITSKLRRGEPFSFTWREDISIGGGRATVWINPASTLAFKFSGSRQPCMGRRARLHRERAERSLPRARAHRSSQI